MHARSLIIAAVLALTSASAAMAHAAQLAPALQGHPVVVRIHADWCPACRATDATVTSVRAKYRGDIHFVDFDVTDAKTSAVASAQAKRLGLDGFYEANKTQTSTVGIIDPRTGAVIATLYADTSLDDYERAIARVATDLRRR